MAGEGHDDRDGKLTHLGPAEGRCGISWPPGLLSFDPNATEHRAWGQQSATSPPPWLWNQEFVLTLCGGLHMGNICPFWKPCALSIFSLRQKTWCRREMRLQESYQGQPLGQEITRPSIPIAHQPSALSASRPRPPLACRSLVALFVPETEGPRHHLDHSNTILTSAALVPGLTGAQACILAFPSSLEPCCRHLTAKSRQVACVLSSLFRYLFLFSPDLG